MNGQIITSWAILTATAGLIAFHIGLFTLVGRERKSPYVINSVFPIFLLCLLTAAVALAAALVPADLGSVLLEVGGWLLVAAFLLSFYRVYRIAVRFIYFVDRVNLKHLPFVRQIRRRLTSGSARPTYSHSAIPVPPDLKDAITKILSTSGDGSFSTRNALDSNSLAVAVEHQGQGNQLLAELALAFLKCRYSVQYMTASRHPIEFVEFVKRFMEQKNQIWKEYTKQLVIVDAYTPHFAFIDSIYPRKTRQLESLGITCIESNMTYAGVHSASSRAFDTIKKQLGKDEHRKPTLVIYEDFHALVDLESSEQYRIFVRHVLPSERMWDGMFTVFLESSVSDADWTLLQACTSMKLDLRSRSAGPSKQRKSPDAKP